MELNDYLDYIADRPVFWFVLNYCLPQLGMCVIAYLWHRTAITNLRQEQERDHVLALEEDRGMDKALMQGDVFNEQAHHTHGTMVSLRKTNQEQSIQ